MPNQCSPYIESDMYRSRLNINEIIIYITSISTLIILIAILFFDNMSILSPNYLLATVAVPHISEAARLVREEKDRVNAEKNALENFIKKIVALEPAKQPSMVSPVSGTQGLSCLKMPSTSGSAEEYSLDIVREAYRETVMDVPHYEHEYNESIEHNMRAEFGPEIAQTATDEGPLFDQFLNELVKQSRDARQERSVLLRSLERELDSITNSKRTVKEVHRKSETVQDSLYPAEVSQIVHGWTRLGSIEKQITAHMRQRQSDIHSGRNRMHPHFLQQYVYKAQPWTYPVLIDGLETVEQINRVRDQIVKHLYSW